MKTALMLCSAFSIIIIFSILAAYISELWKNRRNGFRIPSFKEVVFGENVHLMGVLVGTLIFAIGIGNLVAEHFLESTIIGSFYERGSYRETYEATLYIDEKAVFCLAEVDKSGIYYTIFNILLPYGRNEYIDDCAYEPDAKSNWVDLGEWDTSCKIVLHNPATVDSYSRLDSTVVSNYGEFCGSKEDGTFHFKKCYHARKIDEKNLVYFSSDSEADALGFVMCERCRDKYY